MTAVATDSDMWQFSGKQRPPFAIEPGPGQESVWDYPRPPAIRPDRRLIEVEARSTTLARSTQAVRVCETASPPTFYVPPDDVDFDALVQVAGRTYCEWKGEASYYALAGDTARTPVAWTYRSPHDDFRALAGWVSFYPGRVDCRVAGEHVRPQAGGFYGGWVTNEIVGPFKGDAGTGGW